MYMSTIVVNSLEWNNFLEVFGRYSHSRKCSIINSGVHRLCTQNAVIKLSTPKIENAPP